MSYFHLSYTVSKKLSRAVYREIYLPPSDMPGIATVIHLSQGFAGALQSNHIEPLKC